MLTMPCEGFHRLPFFHYQNIFTSLRALFIKMIHIIICLLDFKLIPILFI